MIVSDLTEEECYLFAILNDPSGLDQAEFLWHVYDTTDGCFRAWPFQWKWWRNMSPRSIDQSARAIGKTWGIKVRLCAFPLLHPGESALITAPRQIHLDPLKKMIKDQVQHTKLLKMLLPKGRDTGISKQPFRMEFVNGATIEGRLPNLDGSGVKGAHPLLLEIDEGQDYPTPGYNELIETVQRDKEGAFWRVHGVTRGAGDYFWKLTQPTSGFDVNRYTAMHTPTWNEGEREHRVELYGGADSPNYRRNVLGLHGDSESPMFVLTRLMLNIDVDETSPYNQQEYHLVKISDEDVRDSGKPIAQLLDLPHHHLRVPGRIFWGGQDVGFTQHPSEILVFAQERPDPESPFKLKLLTRVQLRRVSHGGQVEVILQLIRHYNMRGYGIDKTGNGLPLYQDVQERAPDLAHIIKGYNFSEKILVDFDQTIDVDPYVDDPEKKAGILKVVLEQSSDVLRSFVDAKRLVLPFDRELISDFRGQTFHMVKDNMNIYGKKEFNKGHFHILDAARMAVLAVTQEPITTFMEERNEQPPVVPLFVSF